MKFRNFFVLFNSICLLSFTAHSQNEYIRCDSLIIKIKKPIIGFDKAFIKEDHKWTKIKNFEFTEDKYVLFTLKPYQKKCFNENSRLDFTIFKYNGNSKFFDYQSEVNNDFCSIDGSNKCYKRDKGKNLQKG